MLQWLYDRTLGRLVATQIRQHLLFRKTVLGDPSRLTLASSARVNNALFNVLSGRITVGDDVFFGQNVCLLTGTHDVKAPRHLRLEAIPGEGHDIVIEPGAWIASNTTILGPCVIGEMAVVAAGAVVVRDVAPYTIVAGVPAEVIGQVPRPITPGP